MKVNEAPEKIWIDNLDEGFWFDSPSGNKSIEYVRKDAFIDKAVKWLEDNAIEYWGTEAVDNNMMIYDFKIAMKVDIVVDE